MNFYKQIFLVLLMAVAARRTFAQGKAINIDTSYGGTSWYNERAEEQKRMHLPNMTVVKDGNHWRFWYYKYFAPGFVIDVSGKDSLHCRALISSYAYGNLVNTEKIQYSKFYYKQANYSRAGARALYRAATRVDVANFAIKMIKGNRVVYFQGPDTPPYTVAYSDNKTYTFKTGFLPDNVTQFNSVMNTAEKLISLEQLRYKFKKDVPLGWYSADKDWGRTRKLTLKQIKQYNRYWRRHEG